MDPSPLSLANLAKQSAPAQPLPPSDYPLQLLLGQRSDERSYRQLAFIGAGSLLIHLAVFLIAIDLPSFVARSEPERRIVERRTPLYFPRELITQKAPNRNRVSKQIDLASLIDSQAHQNQQQASPSPALRHFEPPRNVGAAQTQAAPRIMPEAPNLAMNQTSGDPGIGAINGLPSTVPPPLASQSPAPIAGLQTPPKTAPSTPKQQPPGTTRPSLSDDSQSIPAPALPSLEGQPGARHAAIELESDPRGADFKPYLTRILEIVRANWQHVIPENARNGKLHGRTVIEFIINRDGSIPKVVTAQPSGLNQLDLAASTSLMMSSPLPSLPADYKGFQIRLAFTFAYNMPTR